MFYISTLEKVKMLFKQEKKILEVYLEDVLPQDEWQNGFAKSRSL